MCKTFPLEWPSWVFEMFGTFDFASSAGEGALSLRCFLGNGDGWISSKNAFFVASSVMAALPVVVISFIGIFWVVVGTERGRGCLQRWGSRLRGVDATSSFYVSVVVILFLIQPMMTRVGLSILTCHKDPALGGEQYLEADFHVVCWEGTHLLFTATIGVSIFCVYVLGIPAGLYALLKRSKRELDAERAEQERGRRMRAGKSSKLRPVNDFLCKGYVEGFYFWELVIMLRKTAFATIAVFGLTWGADLQVGLSFRCDQRNLDAHNPLRPQAYTGLLVIVISAALHVAGKPFEDPRMDRLEYRSLQTAFLTLFMGSVFSSVLQTFTNMPGGGFRGSPPDVPFP